MKVLLLHIHAICTIGNRLKLLSVVISLSCSYAINSFASQEEFVILPAPVIFSENYPCSRCHHQNETVPGVQQEKFHVAITVEGHTEDQHGCFECHDKNNRDKLRLFSGRTIAIAESSDLCGQCHSTNYKLWLSGLHGKVRGKWNGPKKYASCTTCHDPHWPGFSGQKPEPPPIPPEQTLRWRR